MTSTLPRVTHEHHERLMPCRRDPRRREDLLAAPVAELRRAWSRWTAS